MTKPRVLLADDHSLVLEGFCRILQDHCELVGTVGDGRALLEMAHKENPDIVILDIVMPLLNGIDAAMQLNKLQPSIKIIFVTMYADGEYLRSALEVGASGYLLKRSAIDELEHAIRMVLTGHKYITPLIAKDLLDVLLLRTRKRPQTLTFRQRQIVQFLTEGQTVKNIANLLNISARTVEFHKAQVMEQLNLHTTGDLIKYALAHDLHNQVRYKTP